VALTFVNIIVDQIWLKATIFGLLIEGGVKTRVKSVKEDRMASI